MESFIYPLKDEICIKYWKMLHQMFPSKKIICGSSTS